MTDLGSVLARVAETLERERIPYMVIGGFANLIWGEPRTTMDLDVTVDIESVGLSAFAVLALRLGDPLPDDPVPFAERTRVFPLRSHEGMAVDFVLATLPFELDAIGRARKVRIGDTDVAICAPEDLIVHKAVSSRARDHEDIIGVLRRQGPELNVDRLDQIIGELATELGEPAIAERFRQAKHEAGLH